jgi:phosphoserine phosphatase
MPLLCEAVLIFDLDGTTLGINSFPHWARHLLGARFAGLGPKARAGVVLRTACWLAARKLGLIGHEALKRGLQRGWAHATRHDARAADAYAALLQRHVRPALDDLLAAVAGGEVDAVLATAAAAEYAGPLARRLGFRHVLATEPSRAAHETSNVGEAKCRAVLALLAAEEWQARPRILLTDHRDDLPLIRVCDRTLWFGPEAAMAAVRDEAPGADLVYCGPETAVTDALVQPRVGALRASASICR